MKVLTRDEILNMDDLKIEEVNVPEWNGVVFIRTITGQERDIFEQTMSEAGGLRNLRARLVALTAIDKEGKRIFSEKDAPALGKKSAAVIDRLFKVAQELNGWGIEIEKITKNFLAGLSEDSTSG